MTSNRDNLSVEKFTGDKTFKVDYHNVGAAFYTDDYVEWLQRELAQAKRIAHMEQVPAESEARALLKACESLLLMHDRSAAWNREREALVVRLQSMARHYAWPAKAETLYPERTYTASQIYEARQFTDEDYNELKRNLYPPREKK